MGYEFRHICQVESKKLLWLMGVGFALVLIIQYFELPYGNVVSSLFSVGKPQIPMIANSPIGDSSQNPKILGDQTLLDSLNSTGTNVVHGMANITKISKGKDINLRNESQSERDEGSDDFVAFEEDGEPGDRSSFENLEVNNNSTVELKRNYGAAPEKAREFEDEFSANNVTTDKFSNSSLGSRREQKNASTEKNRSLDAGPASPSFVLPPIGSPPHLTFPTKVDTKFSTPVKKTPESSTGEVVSISDMNDMLLHSRVSSPSVKPRWSSPVDRELLNAKSQIENAPIIGKNPGLYSALYRNVSMFKRSYELMEQTLKVYIYREGERPVFHQPVLEGIYASEGWFMKLLESNKKYVTKNPRKAHLFYLPFSSRLLEEKLYVPNSHSRKNLVRYLKNYLDMIMGTYPFWNRTGGADHFLVACHDWAPSETKQDMAKCIRALCNADAKEGFELGKDVSLPETYVRMAKNPLRELGGNSPSHRPTLAFFAGSMHGYLRPILLQHWENKDPDMKIFGRLPKVKGGHKIYVQYMKSSKYCICAKGYEVNSPRVVEAVFYECVPVIISDNFVPPFFEVLNWESFAVFVQEKDIPNLKKILLSISERRYRVMQQRAKQVQQHFLWHDKPVKYDIFHMILHSVWYNRVFQVRPK